MTEEQLAEIEAHVNTCSGWWEDQAKLRVNVRALIAEVKRLWAENEDLKKSQGYSPHPHWESHWDRGSQEEV